MLRLDVCQDIRRDREEQVTLWRALRSDSRTVLFWNLFCRHVFGDSM